VSMACIRFVCRTVYHLRVAETASRDQSLTGLRRPRARGSTMKYEDACRFLSGTGWLAKSPANIRAAILERCQVRDFEPGQRVYAIGDPPTGLWGVVTGGFALEFATDEHGPHFAHSFRPGMWFGEGETFEPRPHFSTIAATRPSCCLHLPLPALESIARAHPSIWRSVGVLAGAHVADALGAMSDGTIRDATGRVAAILLRLTGIRVHEHLSDPKPELDLTQQDLAVLANMSRGTVQTQLGKLESAGVIARSYGRVQILDPNRLRAAIERSD
jgi:CRP/FNR family cyclic AMP-dependent transcriptional regulator